jgi:hypothetical protein
VSLVRAIWMASTDTPTGIISTAMLLVFASIVWLLWNRRGSDYILVKLWAWHGLIYYTATFVLRVTGIRLGDPTWTRWLFLGSQALRIHAVAVILYGLWDDERSKEDRRWQWVMAWIRRLPSR